MALVRRDHTRRYPSLFNPKFGGVRMNNEEAESFVHNLKSRGLWDSVKEGR